MLSDDLLELERGFWTAGPAFFLAHADTRCLVALEPLARCVSREELAGSVATGPRWSEPELVAVGFLQPTPDVALVTYEAKASRAGQTYAALVSSGYAKREDGWKLVFHQQTPR